MISKIDKILVLLATLFLCFEVSALSDTIKFETTITSPDGKYQFIFYQKEIANGKAQMFYRLNYSDKTIIKESELGVFIENNLFESALAIENDPSENWCENLIVEGVDTVCYNNTWYPVYGERNTVENHYKEAMIHLVKFGNQNGSLEEGHHGTSYDKRRTYKMDVVIRAYNEGVAFRYAFPETTNGLFLHVVGEQTSYSLPEGTMAYYEKWAQGPYHYLPLRNWPGESERPLTLTLKNGLTVSLLEAGVVDYCRTKFVLDTTQYNTIRTSMYNKVDVITPYSTPWRVIMAAEEPGDLLENNDIVLNLNDSNKLKNTSWIKPGKVIRSNLSMKDAYACVDFAAERNLQYVHLDAGWYGPEMKVASDATTVSEERDLKMYQLVNYAASKNIGIIVYVNQRALAQQLDEVLAQLNQWGIKGVKFGFVQIGSSQWTEWLHKAAEYNLMVDVHDEYRPTGVSRTYPNLMTQEGIRGNEEMPDANHNTILPFTRFVAGAGDYTICYFNNRIKNTHAHQLALSVVYYSPLQFLYWYDKPDLYRGEKEIAFFDAVKTVWDDTKVLNGEIGQYITVARQSGDEWYIGGITNTESREILIPFDFLESGKKYKAIIYFDDPKLNTRTNVNIKTKTINNSSELSFRLQASGGVAIHIVPIM